MMRVRGRPDAAAGVVSHGPALASGGLRTYLIVEDTTSTGIRSIPGTGQSAVENAVAAFLAEADGFAVDTSRYKFLMTSNPGEYLRWLR